MLSYPLLTNGVHVTQGCAPTRLTLTGVGSDDGSTDVSIEGITDDGNVVLGAGALDGSLVAMRDDVKVGPDNGADDE